MTALIVCCKRCFADFEPTRDDIMRGIAWWSLCPACRQQDAAEVPAASDEPVEAA